jgi:hypothetical protein
MLPERPGRSPRHDKLARPRNVATIYVQSSRLKGNLSGHGLLSPALESLWCICLSHGANVPFKEAFSAKRKMVKQRQGAKPDTR